MEIQGKKPLMSVGFLLGATYNKVAALLMHRLKPYNITPEQWSVLYHVADNEGMIQKEIAARTYKDKPTVTRILHQLEHKGYITRKEDEVDRRSVRIYVSDQGRQLIAETIAIEESISDEVRTSIGDQSHDQLKQYLTELNSYFNNELETEV